MFCCIYSSSDNSLSVFGKEDKNLKLLGEWETREQAEMKWGKKIYVGTIIRIDDNENDLTRFANSANRKILSSGKEPEEILQDLLSYTIQKSSQTGKRQHVATSRMKESRLQEQDSPSKKKKESKTTKPKEKKTEMKNQVTPVQKKAEKKKKEEVSQLLVASEIAEISDLSLQFSSNQENLENPTDLEQSKRNGPQASSDELVHHSKTKDAKETPLTATWQLCQIAEDDQPDDCLVHEENAPPSDVITIFKLLLKPKVQEYMQKMVDRFGNTNGRQIQSVTLPEPRSVYTNLEEFEETPVPHTAQTNAIPSFQHSVECLPQPQQMPPFQRSVECLPQPQQMPPFQRSVECLPQPQQMQPFQRSVECLPPTQQMPQTDYSGQNNTVQQHNILQPVVVQQPYFPYTSAVQTSTPTDLPPTTPLHYTSVHSLTTPQTYKPPTTTLDCTSVQSTSQTCTSPTTALHFQNTGTITQNNAAQHLQPSPQTPRRSPRKTNMSPSSGYESTTKLFGNRQIVIDKEIMAQAIRLSKKSAKPAYTLTMKLMPGLFSNEEMAQSKGQGLVTKKDDIRPALDKEKVSALKEYVRCWCRTNAIKEPEDTEINAAITERVSYARKLYKRTKISTKQ